MLGQLTHAAPPVITPELSCAVSCCTEVCPPSISCHAGLSWTELNTPAGLYQAESSSSLQVPRLKDGMPSY